MQNQARLKVLKAREEHIRNVLEDARKKLIEVTKDAEMYKKVVQKLIAQGLFLLLEPSVSIRCRQQDLGIVNEVLGAAIDEYKTATKKEVKASVDQENFLSVETCGGIELMAAKGKIKCVNTLESRLNLISHQLLPSVRVALFGRNPNRQFDD
jgi:V-type H+-transporting ATPase subunit E